MHSLDLDCWTPRPRLPGPELGHDPPAEDALARPRPATTKDCSERDVLVRHFLARTLEPVWAGLQPSASRKLAGYYKRLRTIIPESEIEDGDPDLAFDSLDCKTSRFASAPSTALGWHLACDSCISAETDLLTRTFDRSFHLEPPDPQASLPIEPMLIIEDCDDTYNRAARTIQQRLKGRHFFRIIMTVVRLNREFKREEQLALRNRLRKLALEAPR